MSAFPNVIYTGSINRVVKANEKKDRKQMVAAIEYAADQSIVFAQKNQTLIEALAKKQKEQGKALLEKAEQAFENIKSGRGDSEALIKEIEGVVERLKVITAHARQESEDYALAYAADGLRLSNLMIPVLAALKEVKTVPEYQNCTANSPLGKEITKALTGATNSRTQIISKDALLKGERQRVIEYRERAVVLLEAAGKIGSGGSTEQSKFKEEIKTITTSLTTALDLEGYLRKIKTAEEAVVSAAKLVDPVQIKGMITQLAAMLPENETRRKDTSGKLKTGLLQVETLKSVYGNKSFAKSTISTIDKAAKKTESDFKKLEARHAKALKAMDTVLTVLQRQV